MGADRFTYRQFDELLLSLGFTRQHVAPKWRRYNHLASDTMIAVVEKGPDELVRITDAAAARLLLVEKGLISENELQERLVHSAAAQPTTSTKHDGWRAPWIFWDYLKEAVERRKSRPA